MPVTTQKKLMKKLLIRPKKPTKDPLLTKKTKKVSKKSKKAKKPDTEYEKCRKAIINRYMKLFERGILKIRGNPVKSRKQAIAVALQIAAKGCESKMNSDDIREMELKLKRAMQIATSPSNQRPLRYSDILRLVKLYTYYQKKGRKSSASRLRTFAKKIAKSDSIPISHQKALAKVIA